eukprot:15465443-Alexandrium_andersonii.AAC.1
MAQPAQTCFRQLPILHSYGRSSKVRSIRSLNCAGPDTASRLIPGALAGCILRHCSRRCRIW